MGTSTREKNYHFQPCPKRSQQKGALLTWGTKLKKTKLPPSHMYPQANQGEDPKIRTANPMSHLENQEEDQRLLNKLAICFVLKINNITAFSDSKLTDILLF